MTSEAVTRGEFESLWRAVEANGHRLDAIDAGGTRGVGAMAVQITEVIKDVAELKQQAERFQREHEAQHRAEAQARLVSRRWAVATAIAFLAAVEGPLIYLIQVH